MNTKNITRLFAGVAVLGMTMGATSAFAQDNEQKQNDEAILNESKMISLDLEGVDLYVALSMLFKQAKVQYTLDSRLRGTLVTVHLKQPLRRALEAVLKASGLPFTYAYADGIYSIIPRIEEPVNVEPEAAPEPKKPDVKITRIRINNISPIDIVSFLGGRVLHFTNGFMPPYVGFNPFVGGGGMAGGRGGMGGGGGFGGGFGGGMGAGGLGNMGQGGLGTNTFTTGNGSNVGGLGGRGL
jgi:hypothetical protein